jgi:hypothetical protein
MHPELLHTASRGLVPAKVTPEPASALSPKRSLAAAAPRGEAIVSLDD